MTGLELGTDIGGSVRIPASFCGVFGHKPTFGIVPQDGCMDRLDGATAQADINVIGPIARHPRDLALALGVICGPAGRPGGPWRLELPGARHGQLREYRIGTWIEDAEIDLDHEVLATIRAALDRIANSGAMIAASHPDVDLAEAVELYRRLVYAAVSVHHRAAAAHELAGGHRDWLENDHRRRQLIVQWERWFEDFDVLLCPVIPSPAFAHDHSGPARDRPFFINGAPAAHQMATAWTGAIGMLHLPSTAVPVGLTEGGLPVGIQVVGPRYRDADCLRVAELLGEVIGGFRPPPLAL
jgi:amidase